MFTGFCFFISRNARDESSDAKFLLSFFVVANYTLRCMKMCIQYSLRSYSLRSLREII